MQDNHDHREVSRGGSEVALEIDEMQQVVDILNDLVVVNRGMIVVYEMAADRLHDEASIEFVRKAMRQRRTAVAELSNLVATYGANPVTGSDALNMVKRVWIGLKGTVADEDGPILSEVGSEAEKMLDAYGEAMGVDLPGEARGLVRTHMSDARITHEKVVALAAAYKS